ncbi:outer membrane protein : Outer membrane efflux protein OS=Isosphaera pallida (strain ATCC 43644 / DSM 9630 / IS1B) GN=Isop_0341 PE=4 SV=1: OEP: OEP [Gemmata massiliana]|uniref:TolC family protein n=1 Tax=Gemmata massiliana TaxID=1210884 RepID=A0A6P2DID1_9BACT|nr:TolC family protein [Gemmata massiliana]VTS01816.1 outer membrane protein : Outer membrane efflux protein OS=Isosphaera pallida (strain ATCC 43644 / DSM 9630 / IS1B) GN=Isop_0341 PE=4 SV=1: OEP: OEP [Gemmata massiliana]
MRRAGRFAKLGGLAAVFASATGCSVHHYHHFDSSGETGPGLFARASGMPGATGAPPATTTVRRPPPAPDVVVVAHQTPTADVAGPPGPGGKDAPSIAPPPRPLPPTAPGVKTKGMTLDQIINTVLIADPKIRAGLESINQANADALTASLKPNPKFNANQTLLPLTRPFTVDAQGGPPQFDVGLAYPIDWFLFGKRAAAMQSAGLGVRASEAGYADLVRQRVLEAALAYFDVLEAKALFELAAQDLENLIQVEAMTEKAVEGGGRPRVELDRVRLDRLKSEQAFRDGRNALVAATATLRSLMGRADDDPTFEVAGTLDGEFESVSLSVDSAFTTALENRPDLQALRWKVHQAQADTVVERRKAYPDVTPVVGYTRQFQRKAIGFPDASSFGFGFDMSLPISDRNQGNRAKATSVVAQNTHELNAGIVALRAEVVQAVEQLRTKGANARSVAGEQLKLAQQVRDSISKAYEVGGRPLIDVLDAQRNYRETYRLFIASRAGYGRAAVRFNATLGKKVVP